MLKLQFYLSLLWRFLGFFHKPLLRFLHAAVCILVFFQLIGGLGVSPHLYGLPLPDSLPLWSHGLSGGLILFFSILLTIVCLRTNGFLHYFPYLLGDFRQIRKDITETLHGKLVAPRAGGLANTIQGLGMCALLLTALSGASWVFLRWQGEHVYWLLDVHSTAALFLTLYFAGHGAMALLHFRLWLIKTGAARNLR